MTNVANWVKENTSTTGQADLVLTGTDTGYASFAQAFGSSPISVYYSIANGNNREVGIGTFNGTTGLSRDTVHATLVSGTYDDTSPAKITLVGSSVVRCTMTSALVDALALLSEITYETLDAAGDVGTGAGQLAIGNHDHAAAYEPISNVVRKIRAKVFVGGITAGQGVTLAGYHAGTGLPYVITATNNPASPVIGFSLVTEAVADTEVDIYIRGVVTMDTSAWFALDNLYQADGSLVSTAPTDDEPQRVGVVLDSGVSGKFYVHIDSFGPWLLAGYVQDAPNDNIARVRVYNAWERGARVIPNVVEPDAADWEIGDFWIPGT